MCLLFFVLAAIPVFPDSFEHAISVESVQRTSVLAAPVAGATIVGSVVAGARFPIHRLLEENPCIKGFFIEIRENHFVCSRNFRPSAGFPTRVSHPGSSESFNWMRTRASTPVYYSRKHMEQDRPGYFLPANAHLLQRKRFIRVSGELVQLTTSDHFIFHRDLEQSRLSSFSGRKLEGDGDRHQAVVVRYPRAALRDLATGAITGWVRDRTWVRILPGEKVTIQGKRLVPVDRENGIDEQYLRVFGYSAPPAQAAPKDRWIEVNMSSQTLVAYEGERPVFITLVSSGKAGTDTVPGLYRIYYKKGMQDLTRRRGRQVDWFFEKIPYLLFYHSVFAFHPAVWHHSFGTPHSQGCIELPLSDAEFLYHWTSPRMPPGYMEISQTAAEPGTLIRIVRFSGHRVPVRTHLRQETIIPIRQ